MSKSCTDTKELIRNRKLKMYRQCNGQKQQRTNNDLQTTTRKTNDQVTRTHALRQGCSPYSISTFFSLIRFVLSLGFTVSGCFLVSVTGLYHVNTSQFGLSNFASQFCILQFSPICPIPTNVTEFGNVPTEWYLGIFILLQIHFYQKRVHIFVYYYFRIKMIYFK